MSEYRNFIRKDLDGYIVCEDVHFPSGSVCTVFLSPSSIYVLSTVKRSAEDHLRELMDALSPIRLRLYVLEDSNSRSGLYDPLTKALGEQMDEDSLSEDIQCWLSQGREIHDAAATERMIARLKTADIHARGYAVNESGTVFLMRNGTFHEASPLSSDTQYYLTLFGGILGLHRFALGKFWSGLLYLLTGGFMLAGWFIDLLQLFIGMQKDSKKRYLFPLKYIKKKLIVLPVGLLCGLLPFTVYLTVTDMFGLGAQNMMSQIIHNTEPTSIQSLITQLMRLFSQFS